MNSNKFVIIIANYYLFMGLTMHFRQMQQTH